MEADYRTLLLGRATPGASTSKYNWNAVKENAGVTMLSARHPAGGLCYKIVEQYATAYEKQIYPTPQYKAKDGNAGVERDASAAYAHFEALVSSGVGTADTEGGIHSFQATSFEDLDTKLTSGQAMGKELVIELQRTGINDTGARKKALDLRYPESAIMWDKEQLLTDAAIYYRSYPKDTRIAALKDMRESILIPVMEPSVMAEIIRANRVLRKAYQMSEFEGSLNDFSTDGSTPLLPDSTYASFTVRFIDQTGQELESLPYIASVRGAINYREAYMKTNAGKDPANFASGATLFEGSTEAPNGAHQLYRYKINEEVPHRGSFKVQIILPEFDKGSPWANPRLKAYSGSPETVNDRGSIIEAKAGTILTSQAFTFRGPGSKLEVSVPVYREPIPNHLVYDGKGNLVSKWSTYTDAHKLPSHQKVRLRIKLSRLKHSLLWENADRNADGVISQDEYQSPEGEAARNDMDMESKIPVRHVSLELRPSEENIWLSARNTINANTDLSGTATLTAPVGSYKLFMVSQNDSGDPVENEIADIEVPAAVYFRSTTPNDTTPIGIVGAAIKGSQTTLVNFHLSTNIPPMPEGKKPEYGTVYAIKSLPGIKTGWPNNAGTGTSETIFDSLEVILPPLPGEIVLTGKYEDIAEKEAPPEPLPFGGSLTITQQATGSIVGGIDQTPAGMKWKVSRIAIRKDIKPMVTFSKQYDPREPIDSFGRNRYAEASIVYQRAPTMAQGEEYLVFRPDEQGLIVAYPTESVTITTPGSAAEYTYSITPIIEEPTVNTPAVNTSSNALPTPIISNSSKNQAWQNKIFNMENAPAIAQNSIITPAIAQNSIITPATANVPPPQTYIEPEVIEAILQAENTGDAVTANYLSSQAVTNAYQAGNLTYSQAAQQLQLSHGWSQTDVDNELTPPPSTNAGDGLPNAIYQNAANEANRFSRIAQSQTQTQEQATAQATAAAMNTDGDGFITWRNGLTPNEIAAREAASAAAVAEAQAYAATQEGQAATAAEHARIAAAVASARASGRRPSL
jgi:hypothetical protein